MKLSDLLKALPGRKDIAKLSKKTIVNKLGHAQTVYVKLGEDQPSYQAGQKKSVLDSLLEWFNFNDKTDLVKMIKGEYSSYNVKDKFGVALQDWSNYLIDYFTNKPKYDGYFEKNPDFGVGKTQIMVNVKKGDKVIQKNMALVRYMHDLYNKKQGADAYGKYRENRPGTGRAVLSEVKPVGAGQAASPVSVPVQDARPTNNEGQYAIGGSGFGDGYIDQFGLKVSDVKKLRSQCQDILKKADNEITDEEKSLLKNFEGVGGTGAEGKGILDQYYTPQVLMDKVFSLANFFLGKKAGETINALEPSGGTGRAAFNTPANVKFDMIEPDPIAVRINKLINGDKVNVKQGEFQSLFFDESKRINKPEYEGKKYDLVVGNPPYKPYEGEWKGKSLKTSPERYHSKMHEYFIDRGLDTLKEGGVLAFVIPSGFLRGDVHEKDSKIKEIIGKKGKLLAAYRLPNGTFSTTGIGTDIIVVRKEAGGNVDDFFGDNYFKNNPENILGIETTKTGRFGKPERYVSLKDGQTVETVLKSIDLANLDRPNVGQKRLDEATKEKISISMMGNKNAEGAIHDKQKTTYKDVNRGKPITELQSVLDAEKTNEEPDTVRIEALQELINEATENVGKYKNVKTWELARQLEGLKENSKKQPKDSDLGRKLRNSIAEIMRELSERSDYTAVSKQATKLKKREKEQATLQEQTAGIEAEAKKKPIYNLDEFIETYGRGFDKTDLEIWRATEYDTSINIDKIGKLTPKIKDKLSYMNGKWYHNVNFESGNIYKKIEDMTAQKEDIEKVLGKAGFEKQLKRLEAVRPDYQTTQDIIVSPISSFAETMVFDDGTSLIDKFWEWCGVNSRWGGLEFNGGATLHDLQGGVEWQDIVDYVEHRAKRMPQKASSSEKDYVEQVRDKRRENADRLFDRFIKKGLLDEYKDQFEKKYNELFNGNLNTDMTKVPVFVDGMTKVFKGNPLIVKGVQLEGVSFLCNKGVGLLGYEVGVGKAQPLSAKILTPKGWVLMAEIKKGDFVISVDGTPTMVTGVYPQGEKEIFNITFSDGSSTECCGEHLWAVQEGHRRSNRLFKHYGKYQVKSTEQLISHGLYTKRGYKNFSIPVTRPVQFDKRLVAIHPYLMGTLLGNGGMTQGSIIISSADKEIIDNISSVMHDDLILKKKNDYDYSFCSLKKGKNSLLNSLRFYKLHGCYSNNKFIPDDYKYNSIENRIELLRGLMDTDGYASKNGFNVQYCTVSQKLADDVTELVNSLGGTVTATTKIPKYTYNNKRLEGQLAYTLSLCLPPEINPFKLSRKRDRVVGKTKYQPKRFIVSIDFVGHKQAQCISIDHERHLYLTDNYIVTHNTITGVMATIQQMQLGRCKKPLIIVPKSTYGNWMTEIKELFPNVKINDLGNLGGYSKDNMPKMENGTVSICTYQALERMTFKDDTMTELTEDLQDAMQDVSSDKKKNKRGKEKESEQIQTTVGRGSRVKDEAFMFIEDLGIDHITVDEAHNFKNVFSSAKGGATGKGGAHSEFGNVTGSSSARGVKMFLLSQYIQRHNNNRNVFELTATPFTNSPIEIYNTLSRLARSELKEIGIYNLDHFLAQFAKIKTEWAVSHKGEITKKGVIKEFHNMVALQKLLKKYISFKTVEDINKEAGSEVIKRPKVFRHVVELPPTSALQSILDGEVARMNDKNEQKHGGVLKGIGTQREATLSPALVSHKLDGFHDDELINKKFKLVEDSPKLTFTCDLTANIYKQRPDVGHILYMPRGVEQFRDVVAYLEKKGIPKEAIGLLKSESSESATDKREALIKDFNDPKGKVKVVIGSSTILEGINLNGNTAFLHNLMLGWNASETTQLEGRAWRQGNNQSNIHVITPVIHDSADPVMYQKHDEKNRRFSELQNFNGNKMDVSDLNFEEIKFELIKDPVKRAEFQIQLETESIASQIFENAVVMDEIKNTRKQIEQAEIEIPKLQETMKRRDASLSEALKKHEELNDLLVAAKKAKYKDEINRIEMEMRWADDDVKTERNYRAKTKKDLRRYESLRDTMKDKIAQKGVTNIDEYLEVMLKESQRLKEKKDAIYKKKDSYVKAAQEAISSKNKNVQSVPAAIADMTKMLLSGIEYTTEAKAKGLDITAKAGIKKAVNDNTIYFRMGSELIKAYVKQYH